VVAGVVFDWVVGGIVVSPGRQLLEMHGPFRSTPPLEHLL